MKIGSVDPQIIVLQEIVLKETRNRKHCQAAAKPAVAYVQNPYFQHDHSFYHLTQPH